MYETCHWNSAAKWSNSEANLFHRKSAAQWSNSEVLFYVAQPKDIVNRRHSVYLPALQKKKSVSEPEPHQEI